MRPTVADRVRARRRTLLERRLLVLARRTERRADEQAPAPEAARAD